MSFNGRDTKVVLNDKVGAISIDAIISLQSKDALDVIDVPVMNELIKYGVIKCDPLRHDAVPESTIYEVKILHLSVAIFTPSDMSSQNVVDELDENCKAPCVCIFACQSLSELTARIQVVCPDVQCSVGPLKLPGRSLDKSRMDYGGDLCACWTWSVPPWDANQRK